MEKFRYYKRDLTEEEQEKNKIKNYNLLDVYDIGFEGEKSQIFLPLENDIYDKYVIGKINEEKPKKIRAKKKNKNLSFELKNPGTYGIYGKTRNNLLLVIISGIIFLGVVAFGASYSLIPEFKNKVDEFYINTFRAETPTAPEITGGSAEWAKERIIKVKKDAISYSGIDYYEYCISEEENFKSCNWQKTTTKNAIVATTGRYYVVFRAVGKTGKTGSLSNTEEVYIDNESPEIKNVNLSIEDEKLKVEITSGDKHSGVDKIYYKIDEEEYTETKSTFTLSDYQNKKKLTIRVVDLVGNYSELEVDIEKYLNDINGSKNSDNNSDNVDNTANNIENNTENSNTQKELKAPKINLNKIPSTIEYLDSYDLPTYYEFDELGGQVTCILDKETKITNTSEIYLGKHTIECSAVGNNGLTTKVNKEINVIYQTGEDETWDGYIKMNLYYPENSTNWQWRLGNENTIRTGYNNDGWQDYTGPIVVKLTDVENVYIRYTLNGEDVIIPPTGELLVDIEPNSYSLTSKEKTKVKINFDTTAETKEYRINGGDWQDYTDTFEVGVNTLIEARATKQEKVYDNSGNYITTRKVMNTDTVFISEHWTTNYNNGSGSTGTVTDTVTYETIGSGNTYYTTPTSTSTPSTYLEGPIISQDTYEIVDETKVIVTPQEQAQSIYISVDNGKWQEYTSEVTVEKNCLIRAYYYRESDGKKSDITYHYVQNIKQPTLPYVKISAIPTNYLNTTVKEATVSISGYDYNTLEYSYDGKIYFPYTEELKINYTTKVYARGTNDNGTTIESILITTEKVPSAKENLDVAISVSPSQNAVKGLVNKVTVTIDYDTRATKKYYKIGDGALQEYSGPFTLNTNAVIYAYATNNNGYGEAKERVNYLTTGISNPIIEVTPDTPSDTKKVTINYDSNATTKKYKIDNGVWQEYTGDITVEENCIIYAYNEDVLGNIAYAYSQIEVQNVPRYTLIDKGSYFIIKLNYPTTSLEENREYKWTPTGDWKTYDSSLGILLIKPEYKDEVLTSDGAKIEDDKGNEIIYTDHYYFIDCPMNELMENLFMRWDSAKLSTPTFVVVDTEATKELNIGINYDTSSTKKLYKVVTPSGTETNWLEYNGAITVTENGTVIYAKSANISDEYSKTASYKVTNIDESSPNIEAVYDDTTAKRSLTILLSGTDDLTVEKVGYAKGKKDASYFKKNGTLMENNSTFKVTENGTYTVCAIDAVGNITTKQIEITNIDKDAPNIIINVLTNNISDEIEFEVDYGDSITKEYKIGTKGEYQEYTDKVTVKALDVKDLANEDKTITIYAKGTDEAGNESEVNEIVYTLDLDIPNEPIIEATAGYPTITEEGITVEKIAKITYDNRDDITNYYSIDGGETWTIYTKAFEITSESIMAKSVKNDTGLTVTATKELEQVTDALGLNAYDEDETSYENIVGSGTYAKKIIYVEEAMQEKYISLTATMRTYNAANGYAYIKFYNENNEEIETMAFTANTTTTYTNKLIKIPKNTTKIEFVGPYKSSAYYINVYEIKPSTTPAITQTINYPTMNANGFTEGYNEITIGYLSYLKDKLYTLSEGSTWKKYKQSLVVEEGKTVQAKAIDKDGNESDIDTLTVTDDQLDSKMFDKDQTTTGTITKNTSETFNLTEATNGRNIRIYMTTTPASNATIKFYDENNTEVGSYALTGNLTVKEIPNGSVKATIAAGSSNLTISEINLREELNITDAKVETPSITIDKAGWASEKEINITYPEGNYLNEYSLDNGETWNEYTESFKVAEELVIFARSSDGKKVVTSSSFKITMIDTTIPTISLDDVSSFMLAGNSYNLPTSYTVNTTKSGGSAECSINGEAYTNTKTLEEGTHYINCTVTTGAGVSVSIEKRIDIFSGYEDIEADSLLSALSDDTLTSGYYNFKVTTDEEIVEYAVRLYVLDGDQEWSENMTFGDANDVATASTYAKNMIIVKVNGDLIIDSGVTVAPYYTSYGGPKGFTLYVTGKLANNGTIDNSHGAKAVGQNVYLWKNTDGTYETVSAIGGSGGARVSGSDNGTAGKSGSNGTGRQTGGGGSGGASFNLYSGAGSAGTSYSGGSGGGASSDGSGGAAGSNGGAGGKGGGRISPGGAGNPGGSGYRYGSSGTGGLLVIYSNEYENNGTISAHGYNGATEGKYGGGSSGGGSINIFCNNDILSEVSEGSHNISGGVEYVSKRGGNGGTGTYNIGSFVNNQYCALDECAELIKINYENSITYTGDSIVSILNENTDLETGYYIFKIDEEKYYVHLYIIDGDQQWSTDQIFGDENDVATDENDTSNTIIVKVNGNLIIDEGVKVTTYGSENSDNKDLILYVTGTLTNNGEITYTQIGNDIGTEEATETPNISIDSTEWSTEKAISISYPEEYTNEYSIDNGETWNEYTESIKVTEETVVIARSIDENGKVISSSSFTITKVDNEEPNVEIIVSDRVEKGSVYETLANVDYTKSGGVTECTINGDTYSNISELEVGTYTIVCTTTTGSGKIKVTEKEIEIYDPNNEVIIEETPQVEESEENDETN